MEKVPVLAIVLGWLDLINVKNNSIHQNLLSVSFHWTSLTSVGGGLGLISELQLSL